MFEILYAIVLTVMLLDCIGSFLLSALWFRKLYAKLVGARVVKLTDFQKEIYYTFIRKDGSVYLSDYYFMILKIRYKKIFLNEDGSVSDSWPDSWLNKWEYV